MMLGFGVTSIVVQMIFCAALRDYIGGDPVLKFRVCNLKELRSVIPIPKGIIVLDIIAKAFGYAAFCGLMLWLGWV